MGKIVKIKKMIKKECKELGKVDDWFYDGHLLAVEKFAKELQKKLPEADEEILMLSVWLHDIQRVRGLGGDHARAGADESKRVLKKLGYSKSIISEVAKNIRAHRCNGQDKPPSTIEGKILASADAMSHYTNDFYLNVAISSGKSTLEFKDWALEKLDRDYNDKIFFNFAKKLIQKKHDTLNELFTMN